MQTVATLSVLRKAVDDLRRAGGSVALVPTMGALHEGHLTLVRAAKAVADHVVVSIFVNPRQFGPKEDFGAYPRQMVSDSRLLMSEGVALLWAPERAEIYPEGYATNVGVTGVSEGLCGADRPGHFDGVATIVCKLFNQVRPDMAFFGEKDWQQLAVIRRMARDLDLTQPDVGAIHGVSIVREADGLAMSSRNAYLSPQQREIATALPTLMRKFVEEAPNDAPQELERLRNGLLKAGFDSVDYAELRDGDSLAPVSTPNANSRLFVAARIGGTRLIDNMAISGVQSD